jgi:hypothetical protein
MEARGGGEASRMTRKAVHLYGNDHDHVYDHDHGRPTTK